MKVKAFKLLTLKLADNLVIKLIMPKAINDINIIEVQANYKIVIISISI